MSSFTPGRLFLTMAVEDVMDEAGAEVGVDGRRGGVIVIGDHDVIDQGESGDQFGAGAAGEQGVGRGGDFDDQGVAGLAGVVQEADVIGQERVEVTGDAGGGVAVEPEGEFGVGYDLRSSVQKQSLTVRGRWPGGTGGQSRVKFFSGGVDFGQRRSTRI